MGITLVIVGGILLMTAMAVAGDYLTKSRVAKPRDDGCELAALRQRVEALEKLAQEQEAAVRKLESNVEFTNRLLEDKRS